MRQIFFLAAASLLTLPSIAFAQDSGDGVELINPLSTTDVRDIIGIVIKAALGLSGSIALVMFIWGGFLWLTSQGNTEKIDAGRKTMTWAAIGLVVIFSAYTIVNAIFEAATSAAG